MQKTIVNRNTFYNEAWETPMSALAERYGISDVALAKICRKLKVPVPPRGYWARIRNGQRVTKPKLPQLASGIPETATIAPVRDRSRAIPEAVIHQLAFEADPKNRISTEHFNRRLHPLVAATKTILQENVARVHREVALDIRVSRESRDRAYRLMSGFIYAFEERGFSVKATPPDKEGSLVIVRDEPLRFSLEEHSKQVAVPESNRTYTYGSRFDLVPDGKLTFRIHDYWAQGARKTWSDGVRRSLEEQINDIIPALVDISLIAREGRLKREKVWAARAEQERLRALDEARRRQLDADLRKWQASGQLKDFITTVATRHEGEKGRTELDRWIAWAMEIAGSMDPCDDGLKSFLTQYKF